MASKDNLGDKLKHLEGIEAKRAAIKGLPIMARIDGKNFSKFTRGLLRPYDKRLSDLMIETTKYLVEQTHAKTGYTQSDEITLCWSEDFESGSQYPFDGKYQKLVSILASTATAYFNTKLASAIPEKEGLMPKFDARVWQVPNERLVYLNFLWREQDATKNSISMAARSVYSHKELHGKTGSEMQQMLLAKNINWNDYPAAFKRGTYVQRTSKTYMPNDPLFAGLPEKHKPTEPVIRSKVESLNIPILSTIEDPVTLLLKKSSPQGIEK